MISQARELRFTQQEVRRPQMPTCASESAYTTMTYDKLHTIRSFFRRLRDAEFSTPGRKSALLVLSAVLLSSIASGQIPTTTALPYVLTDQAGVIRITPIYGTVAPVPAAAGLSGFGSLLGGGFGSLLATPTASAASAAATASVRSLLMMKKANDLQNNFNKMEQDAKQAEQKIESENPELFCEEDEFTPVKFNHQLKTSVKARVKARLKGGARAADSPACTLPEEQQAEEAEEELQTLQEAGDTTQEALEAAEEAAETAEAAAEAAETAAEAALDGLDVIEGILDALSLI